MLALLVVPPVVGVALLKRLPLNHPLRVAFHWVVYWFRCERPLAYWREPKVVDYDTYDAYPKPVRKSFLSRLRQRISFLFGYRPRPYTPNSIASMWFLSFLMKLNPWPIELTINNEGVFFIKRSWHGLKVREKFYPLKQIRSVSVQVILGHFTEIQINVLNEYGQITALKTKGWFFNPTQAGLFFFEYTRLSSSVSLY